MRIDAWSFVYCGAVNPPANYSQRAAGHAVVVRILPLVPRGEHLLRPRQHEAVEDGGRQLRRDGAVAAGDVVQEGDVLVSLDLT